MNRILKWLGIVFGGLIGLIIVAAIAVFVITNSAINKIYDFPVASVAIPSDEAAIAKGKHVATIRTCVECHAQNLAGKVMIDEAPGLIVPGNLTSGKGGIGESYSDEDWIRAIRHGIGPDKKALIFMPAHEYYFLSDEDLGALIAYLKSVPAVDNELPDSVARPLGRVLFLAGIFDLLPATKIDHTAPRPEIAAPSVTVEYGQNLAVGCIGCHGANFSGGEITGAPADWPPARNLTPAERIADWAEEDFVTVMRTGVTPDGHEINPTHMPWTAFSEMTDDELSALWLYLQSLPAAETGSR